MSRTKLIIEILQCFAFTFISYMRVDPKIFTVYITTNYNRTVYYTGITNNLLQRITEHYLDKDAKKTFAGKYNAFYVLYFETHDYVLNAIAREKKIKGWRREKKVSLIKSFNAEMKFLNEEVFEQWPPKEVFHCGGLEE
jgi:putative endonuclease